MNKELDLAWKLVEYTGVNVFLTGKAGSGKTTFLRNLRSESSKRMIVLAPTGHECRWSYHTLFFPTAFCSICSRVVFQCRK